MLKECLVGRMAIKPAVPKDYREEKKVLNGKSYMFMVKKWIIFT